MSQTRTKKTSSKKKPQNRNIKMSDGTIIKANNNSHGGLSRGETGVHKIPKKKFSTETGKGYNDYLPEDVTDNYDETLKYPPPLNHPKFRKFWAESVDTIASRPGFQLAQLGSLEVLCRLRVELAHLDEFVMTNGHTYRVVMVSGEKRETYPEVKERLKVINAIAAYMRLLGLNSQKHKNEKNADEEVKDADEWS